MFVNKCKTVKVISTKLVFDILCLDNKRSCFKNIKLISYLFSTLFLNAFYY